VQAAAATLGRHIALGPWAVAWTRGKDGPREHKRPVRDLGFWANEQCLVNLVLLFSEARFDDLC
jgi:hypothetical protein